MFISSILSSEAHAFGCSLDLTQYPHDADIVATLTDGGPENSAAPEVVREIAGLSVNADRQDEILYSALINLFGRFGRLTGSRITMGPGSGITDGMTRDEVRQRLTEYLLPMTIANIEREHRKNGQ